MKKIIMILILLCFSNAKAATENITIRTFTATAYCHGSKTCSIKSKGITAAGTKVKLGVVAASRELKFGTKIRVLEPKELVGVYTVEDRGSKITKNKLDFWLPSQRAAIKFGVKKVKVQILKDLGK